MSINTLPTNTTILDKLALSLIPSLPSMKLSTFASQLTASGASITVQNETIAVTPNEPIFIGLSFNYSLVSTGTGTATISIAVNGGTAQTFTFPIVASILSSSLQTQVLFLTFTPTTASANIVATLTAAGVDVTGGSGTTSMFVVYK